jgi:hypothetical protein
MKKFLLLAQSTFVDSIMVRTFPATKICAIVIIVSRYKIVIFKIDLIFMVQTVMNIFGIHLYPLLRNFLVKSLDL